MNLFKSVVYKVYEKIIIKPLNNIYFKGPSFLGFWEGKVNYDICAEVSGVSALFWEKNTDECVHILSHKSAAFVELVSFGLYVFLLYYVMNIIALQLFVIYPIKKQIQCFQKQITASKTE